MTGVVVRHSGLMTPAGERKPFRVVVSVKIDLRRLVLDNLAIAHSHYIYRLKVDFCLRWGKTHKFATVGAVICLKRCDAVSIGDLPMDLGTKVGKCRAQVL